MLHTPRYVSLKVDQTIDYLNATWDLQLPRLYGVDAAAAIDELSSRARRCSARIRYLCYRNQESVNRGITEFEEDAKTIFSHWVWKPLQEKETLPTTLANDSFLRRDIISSKSKCITQTLREQLVRKLAAILDEEYALARDSESYERTASNNVSRSTSGQMSFTSAITTQSRSPSTVRTSFCSNEDLLADTTFKKRRQSPTAFQVGKRSRTDIETVPKQKNQLQIDGIFQKSKPSASLPSPRVTNARPSGNISSTLEKKDSTLNNCDKDVATSFNTTTTEAASVFSVAPATSSFTSTAISAHSSAAKYTPDLLPTQEGVEVLADVSFRSELEAADETGVPPVFDVHNPGVSSPFRPVQPIPGDVPFWLRWEIYRVAQNAQIPVLSLYEAIKTHHHNSLPTYDEAWAVLGGICKTHNVMLPSRSDIRHWMEKSGSYESPDGKTAYFSFELRYSYKPGPYLWTLILNPIKIDKGNRLHRKFGADRHIVGFLNFFDSDTLPKWVTSRISFDAEDSFESIVFWLATGVHHIAGRQWRSFFLEPEKKRRLAGEIPRQKLSMFAIDGDDFHRMPRPNPRAHKPASITQLIKWHIPFQPNLKSTDLKLFSRFGLALSKTRATVTLEPSQFRHRADVEPVMNDGCALMSMGMAKAVWDICGDGSNDVPSAFQARIGGAKGLWIVDYRDSEVYGANDIWIEVTDSQLKIHPHPKDRYRADETQRVFEVLKWSTPCTAGHLNIQLINILADREVPRSALRKVVLNDIEAYIDASRGAMKDARLLQGWIQDYHGPDRHECPVSFENGLPDTKEEEVCFLVQSGFNAENCEFLRHGIIQLMTQRLNTYVEKLRIEIPHSTSVFCVPDPYQVLEEDEVYIGFSNHWENPKTGFKEVALHNLDVLVARNPAALASDIQKRRAVYKHALRNFKDVIVFPTKGKIPLASLLSGGDYDGDTVTVIWDPELVDSFCNANKAELPSEAQCGLQKVAKPLTDIVQSSPESSQDADSFLVSSMMFNARPSRLGICTNEHEQLVYNGTQLSDPGPVLLAALAGYLVDANKQGLLQTASAWLNVRKAALGGRKLLPLAYKNGENPPRRGNNNECINILDHLKFDVAMQRKEDILVEFEKMLPDARRYDTDLVTPYQRELERSKNINDPQGRNIKVILEDLEKKLRETYDEWLRRSKKREKETGRSAIATDIRHVSRMVQNITPVVCECDLYNDYLREQLSGHNARPKENDLTQNNQLMKGSRWSILRASTMYKLYSRTSILWWILGDELGRLKARSLGATRELTPFMHHVLKADSKLIKRLAGGTIEDENDDCEE